MQTVGTDTPKLKNYLLTKFDEGSWRTVVFDSPRLRWDNIPGETFSRKVTETIQFFNRQNVIEELLKICIQNNPSCDFSFLNLSQQIVVEVEEEVKTPKTARQVRIEDLMSDLEDAEGGLQILEAVRETMLFWLNEELMK